jgi:hypothetical protein
MMQVNADFAPTLLAMFRKPVDQKRVELLSRIEIRMLQGISITIRPLSHQGRILLAPSFNPLLLNISRCSLCSIAWNNGRLEVICKCNDQVHTPARTRAKNLLVYQTRPDSHPIPEFRHQSAIRRPTRYFC